MERVNLAFAALHIKLDGVALLVADPPIATPPLFTVGWFANIDFFFNLWDTAYLSGPALNL